MAAQGVTGQQRDWDGTIDDHDPFCETIDPHGKAASLEVDAQIQVPVKVCDLLVIAVEGKRGPSAGFSQTLLGRLAPARMRYCRIHVGIEAIFVWSLSAPRCRWLGRDKSDFDNRFDSFESVLPGHDESNGCAILG